MDLDSHPSTTPEIRSLCADLGVLGRVDFKNLLKWRLAVRKSRGLDGKRKASLRGGVAAAEEDVDGTSTLDAKEADDEIISDSDEKILEEMAELQQGVDARARRDKKKKAKLRAKERVRTALGLVGQDEEGATGASEMDLFSLARIKSKGGLRAVQTAAAPGVDASRDSDDDLGDAERRAGARGRYDDSSEEDGGDVIDGRANDARLEAELDLMWREYKARHTKKGVRFAEKTKGRDERVVIGAGEIGSEDDDDEADQAGAAMRRAGQRALARAMQDAAPSNPLLYDPDADARRADAKPTEFTKTTDWFANDLFAQAAPEVGSRTHLKSEAKAELRKAREAEARAKAAESESDGESDEDGFDEDDEYFDAEKTSADDAETSAGTRSASGEEDDATPSSDALRNASKKRVGADVGDADSDEEDYDALRVASAAKKKKEDARLEKRERREAAKAASLKKQKKRASSTPGSSKKAAAYDDTYDDDTDSSEDDGGAGLSGADPAGAVAARARAGRDNAGFLEAPAELEARSDSSGSDTESDDPDDISDGEKAEILAIGKNMIRKKDRVRFFALRRRRRASVFRSLVDARRRSTFLVTVFRFFRSPLSRAGEDDLSLENNRHRLNLDGRSSECPGT